MKTSEVNPTRMIGKKSFVGNDVRERCEWVTVALMWLPYITRVRFDLISTTKKRGKIHLK